MVANLKQESVWMSEEDYLRTEAEREIKHEYILQRVKFSVFTLSG